MLLLRLFVITLLIALMALMLVPVALFFGGMQPQPLVQVQASPRQDDVERLKGVLGEHDPRRLQDGAVHKLSLTERDINVGLGSVLPMPERQRARVALDNGQGALHYTLGMPQNPLGNYLNVSLLLTEGTGLPGLEQLQVGDITLPGWSLAPLLFLADHYLRLQFPEYGDARQALQQVSFDNNSATLTYRWDRELAKQLEQRGRDVFLSPADRERAVAYYAVLSEVSHTVGRSAPLHKALQPLFSKAEQRSTNGEAKAENRALLLVLGTVLNRSSMQRLVGDDTGLQPGHQYVRWTLHGRNDLAQHFSISAAIAAAGGDVLADAIGAMKELDDSRGGSGFSFPDLLADRAGVEISGAALGPDARRLQRAMAAATLTDADYMPAIDRLPEGLMELEFKQRYSDLDDERYKQVKQEIDGRIEQLPIYSR